MCAYAMRITDLDPLQHGLIFERFLNPERKSMPDFDVDFDERRRGEVIQYVVEKYGIPGKVTIDNTLAAVEITGAQLRDYLEYSARYFVQTKPGEKINPAPASEGGHTQATIDGKTIWDYNYDAVTGVKYSIDISKPQVLREAVVGITEHAQDLLGTLSKAHASGDQTEPKSASVRLELQADCYADAYLKWTSQNRDDVIDNVTCDNLTKVVEAARAVGDDHIQHQSSGSVQPDKWTHGSSHMRVHWAQRGFDTGNPAKCDTFSTSNLR